MMMVHGYVRRKELVATRDSGVEMDLAMARLEEDRGWVMDLSVEGLREAASYRQEIEAKRGGQREGKKRQGQEWEEEGLVVKEVEGVGDRDVVEGERDN